MTATFNTAVLASDGSRLLVAYPARGTIESRSMTRADDVLLTSIVPLFIPPSHQYVRNPTDSTDHIRLVAFAPHFSRIAVDTSGNWFVVQYRVARGTEAPEVNPRTVLTVIPAASGAATATYTLEGEILDVAAMGRMLVAIVESPDGAELPRRRVITVPNPLQKQSPNAKERSAC
jgi:hypothetical protein